MILWTDDGRPSMSRGFWRVGAPRAALGSAVLWALVLWLVLR